MADTNTRDLKLIQYLNEAYGKEKELETALEAHIAMASERPPYKKRLQDHLKETKAHARAVERRIKQLGGKAESGSGPGPGPLGDVTGAAQTAATKAVAAAKGPLHAIRGTGDQEKMLKNAKTEFWNEHEEIATYTSIETLAETVGDKETAKLARGIRREEERMATFLEKQIVALTKGVAREEIPAAERRTNGGRKRTSRQRSSSGGRATRSRSGSSSRSGASSRSGSSSRSGASSRSGSSSRSGGTRRSAAARSRS